MRHININFYLINRITGLDPTSSGFDEPTTNLNYLPSLSSSDAEFTDVIHTDAGFYGAESDLVTCDFWPNFGHRHQPGCDASNVYNKETAKNGMDIMWYDDIYEKKKTDFIWSIMHFRTMQSQAILSFLC